MTASITPSSASSKIMIGFFGRLLLSRQTNVMIEAIFRLYRDATVVKDFNSLGSIEAATAGSGYISTSNSLAQWYIDSPSTTSSITYKLQMRLNTSANNPSGQIDTSANFFLLEF